jgi:hypothetical protein
MKLKPWCMAIPGLKCGRTAMQDEVVSRFGGGGRSSSGNRVAFSTIVQRAFGFEALTPKT